MSKSNLAGVRAHREAQWRERIARQSSSGMSIEAFCRNESISTPSFYAWRKRLHMASGVETLRHDSAVGSFIEVGRFQSGSAGAKKMPPQGQGQSFEVRLELGEGIVLHLSRT